ncbi:DUF2092 domain-containing protein [Streptosporangiaceae bacterium NEAU-GS5]|nr:DUF2092 domain-containing protein [Streptosporangiaceae bacterium NEAU-GS5]
MDRKVVRWAVPVAALAVVAGAIGARPVIAAVQGDPDLPDRTAQQLLNDLSQRWQKGDAPAMSGTVVETASLGLPALPAFAGASPIALLSGSHQIKVWYGDARHIRVALPGEISETDLIANGGTLWWWDSAANTATKLTGPQGKAPERPSMPPVTPDDAAKHAMSAVDGSTALSVAKDVKVAGRDAYELIAAPNAADSLIKDVRLAVDGETLVPLRVQVFAKGAAEPAFEVGFDSITFAKPAPENFTFTPPAGAKVEQRSVKPDEAAKPYERKAQDVRTVGTGWTQVAVTAFDPAAIPDQAGMKNLSDALLGSATKVSGTWGSGRLIQTKLLSALLTDDGRLITGAVTPEVLYRAAGTR